MDRRQQHGGRWNTGQLLRTIDDSHFPDERRHAPTDSSNHSTRSLVSRFGMTDMSCFPSARSRRAFARTESHRDELVRRPGSQRRAQPRGGEPGGSSSRQEKGKSQVFPRAGRGGLVIRDSNELPAFTGTGTEERSSYFHRLGSTEAQSDSDDQVFDLPLVDESFESDRLQVYRTPTETATNSRSSTKRKSYTGASARGSASSSGGTGNKSREEQLRGLNLRRSSSSTIQTRPASMESHRPQKIRVSRRTVDVSSSSSRQPSLHASGSGENSQPSSFNELITGHLDRQANARRSSSSASRSRRSYQGNSSTDTLTRSLRTLSSSSSRPRAATAAASGEGTAHRFGRTGPARSFTRAHDELTNANSHILSRRNISNCFPALGSQGRRSSSPRELGRTSGLASSELPSSSSSGQASTSLLATAIDNVTSSSSSSYPSSGRASGESSSSSQEVNWSSGFGWEYHRPRLMAEGLAKILMALERVETEDELTHEQLLMLEATVLFGGMALHDQHRDWRMDVDNMSYEELLDLGERIGNVNTGLTKDDISVRLSKTVFSSSGSRVSRSGEENEIKCTICQEEYKDGEQLGWIDCGHQYHSECIRKWLAHKNICPICKATALS